MVGQVGFGRNIDAIDVIDLLPASSQARLQAARLRRADALGALRTITDQIAELRETKTDLEGQLKRLQGMRRDARSRSFGGTDPYVESPEVALLDAAARANAKLTAPVEGDSPQVVDLKSRVARIFGEMRRLGDPETQRANLFNTRGRLVTNIETFVRDFGRRAGGVARTGSQAGQESKCNRRDRSSSSPPPRAWQ